MRLPRALAVVATALLLTVTACGSSDAPSDAASAGSSAATEEGAFPVTIDHKYGSTTIEAAPKRVVVVGLKEQDDLLALDVVPVATTEWLDDTAGAIYPWATSALGDNAKPEVLDQADGIQVEKIAALTPDLIIGLYSGMTKQEYTALSKIATTVAQPGDVPDDGISWQDETFTVGEAVGKSEFGHLRPQD